MRKLILLALAIWGAKKLSRQLQVGQRTPFPTSSRPPEGYNG
jgi:hypothetical protein